MFYCGFAATSVAVAEQNSSLRTIMLFYIILLRSVPHLRMHQYFVVLNTICVLVFSAVQEKYSLVIVSAGVS